MFLKVIACEIAFREICHAAAHAKNLTDLEFLPQGYHHDPPHGRKCVQERIEAVPEGKYDAILLGYGLCGNILNGIKATHTPLIIPRAHDCITFFLGSHERYMTVSQTRPGAYFYTSGWLECLRRRGDSAAALEQQTFLPSRASIGGSASSTYQQWVERYGEEQAKYLMSEMDRWTANYTHGVLIQFDFTRALQLREQVQAICDKNHWQFEERLGDLALMQAWLDGNWDAKRFLTIKPGEEVMPTYNDAVMAAKPASVSA